MFSSHLGRPPDTRAMRIVAVAVVCVCELLAPLEASARWDIRRIMHTGMRVKVEGRAREIGILEADEVEMKGDGEGDVYVEGIVGEIDSMTPSLTIAGIRLQIDRETIIRDPNDREISINRLATGARIRVEVPEGAGRMVAGRIRLLDSKDHDVEIKAPIESVIVQGRKRMDVVVLGVKIQCDEQTAFFDPDRNRIEFDFTELDIYRRPVDNDEERPVSPLTLYEFVTVSGEVQVDIMPERNFDLSEERESDVDFSRFSSRLEFLSRPHRDFDLFLKVAAQEPIGPSDPLHPVRSEGDIRLAEAYFLWRSLLTDHLGIRIGRQDFDEKREWLYDENLDAVRLYLNFHPFLTEFSASTNFSEDQERNKGVVNYMIYTSYDLTPGSRIAAYLIHREDDDAFFNHDRRWYGLRSAGRVGKSLDYWIDLAILAGERRGRKLDAEAFDIGFTHVLKGILWEPSFTFGYAYGSGDVDFRDSIDGNFRQTDFEDNNDKFNGVNSFKYYGEVIDPELSNLRITTVGVGFRWLKRGSLDIVYHTYRQVVPDNKIHGSDLLIEPTGDHESIGDEVDLLVGYEKIWNFDLKVIAGFFRPGSGFGASRDTASKTRFQVEYNF